MPLRLANPAAMKAPLRRGLRFARNAAEHAPSWPAADEQMSSLVPTHLGDTRTGAAGLCSPCGRRVTLSYAARRRRRCVPYEETRSTDRHRDAPVGFPGRQRRGDAGGGTRRDAARGGTGPSCGHSRRRPSRAGACSTSDRSPPWTARPFWVGKLIDEHGALQIVYRASDGAIGGRELLASRNARAVGTPSALTAKADRALVDALASSAADESLPVAVWLAADPRAAVAAVIARHPEVEWRGDRPVVDDLLAVRALRAELDAARAGAYRAAESAVRARVEALGGRIGYASTNAPCSSWTSPPAGLPPWLAKPGVASLGLEAGWTPTMSAAGPTVDANWTSGTDDQGTGIRIGVVEYHNVRATGDLAGRVAASYSTTGTLAYTGGGTFDHPSWVAGAIASQSGTYRGVAPGALIVSSGTGGYTPSLTADRAVVAAADWAISASGGDADIVNTSLVQDTAIGAEEARRFFDAIAYEGGRLPVSAAGNYANGIGWQVGSPGSGYNVLTVGGVDDRGTARRAATTRSGTCRAPTAATSSIHPAPRGTSTATSTSRTSPHPRWACTPRMGSPHPARAWRRPSSPASPRS